ncbi:MAG: methyltransferase domain-containing protein [Clostridiaceae bacterium]|jgi:ubiquinone/menaquinone biosynthesis C-methylase UbiE|nr:methyltransferase domain-containing protein [Clostridiaceae bacterium]
MTFEDLKRIKSESERVSKLYEIFNEEKRLLGSKAGKVEFLTTIQYINSVLKKGDRILDIGAGTGAYSFYFDELGYKVTAVELADKNIEVFKSKMNETNKIELIQANALDLSCLQDKFFDVVLLFGPLYHLEKSADRDQAINEAKRLLKDEGALFISYINHDIIHLTESDYNPNWFDGNTYDHVTFRIDNFPFVFFTLEEAREMILSKDLIIEKEIATDGLSELLAEKINLMSDTAYGQYLAYHMATCEDIHKLKATNHFLFQCRKSE